MRGWWPPWSITGTYTVRVHQGRIGSGRHSHPFLLSYCHNSGNFSVVKPDKSVQELTKPRPTLSNSARKRKFGMDSAAVRNFLLADILLRMTGSITSWKPRRTWQGQGRPDIGNLQNERG